MTPHDIAPISLAERLDALASDMAERVECQCLAPGLLPPHDYRCPLNWLRRVREAAREARRD